MINNYSCVYSDYSKDDNANIMNAHCDVNNLLYEIDHTITIFGNISLSRMLKNLISNYDELTERQEIIKYICISPIKILKIRKLLTKIKKNQDLVYEWLDFGFDTSLFSSYQNLNTNYYLDAINKAKYSSIVITLIIYLIMYIYGRYTGTIISFYDYLVCIYQGYVDQMCWLISFVSSSENILYYVSHILSVAYTIYQMINFYNLYNGCTSHYNLCEGFKNKFHLIEKLISECEQIVSINLFDLSNLSNLSNLYDSSKIMTKVKDLKKIFSTKFMLGDYLMTQYNRNTYKQTLNDIIGYIGSVDAYISISHLLTKNYSLPFFIENKSPVLAVSNVWNPLIDYEINVKNDFNPLEKNLTIITGPNKAGKSTYMRSIYTSIYLAQTIGVSPCEQIILTPYKYLFTYLNVPDVIGRESLFEAELNRIYKYYEFVKELTNNDFALSIIDELFTGTNPKEGAATSAAFCKFLSQNKNSTNVVSTHFNHINISYFDIHYCKFTAQFNKISNKHEFDYKVTNGVSDQHIAIELLKEKGYDKKIIDDALYFLNV